MAQPKEKASKGATNDRKRPHTDEYTFEEEGSVVWSADSGESVQVFDGEPLAKRPKVMGRPPLPDVECEHGMMSKRCQKCVYRNRQLKVRLTPFPRLCASPHAPFPLVSFKRALILTLTSVLT